MKIHKRLPKLRPRIRKFAAALLTSTIMLSSCVDINRFPPWMHASVVHRDSSNLNCVALEDSKEHTFNLESDVGNSFVVGDYKIALFRVGDDVIVLDVGCADSPADFEVHLPIKDLNTYLVINSLDENGSLEFYAYHENGKLKLTVWTLTPENSQN